MAARHCILLASFLLLTAVDARQLLQDPSNGGGVKTPQWNVTLGMDGQDRRMALGFGESCPVSVTFYNTPGMDCSDAQGQCGYGNDVDGPAMDEDGKKFVANDLYPYHAASGNFEFLGGCGACGILSGNGVSHGFVITDVTDHKDDLDHSAPGVGPQGSHIDICLPEFQEYAPGTTGSSGGIFTGTWTRVDCSTMGAPNYPDNKLVIRYQAYNPSAKAVVIARGPGAGVIKCVTFVTAADRNGGNSGNGAPVNHSGQKVDGWGAWWTPGADLSNLGGIRLLITMENGQTITQTGYPMPDYRLWTTGDLINLTWQDA